MIMVFWQSKLLGEDAEWVDINPWKHCKKCLTQLEKVSELLSVVSNQLKGSK